MFYHIWNTIIGFICTILITLTSSINANNVTSSGAATNTWVVFSQALPPYSVDCTSNKCISWQDIQIDENTFPSDVTILSIASSSVHNEELCMNKTIHVHNILIIQNATEFYSYMGCRDSDQRMEVTLLGQSNDSQLIVENMQFENVDFKVKNVNVLIRNGIFWNCRCLLENQEKESMKTSLIKDTKWYGETLCTNGNCFPSSNVFLSGLFDSINLEGNTFSNTLIDIKLGTHCDVTIDGCIITNQIDDPVRGGIFVDIHQFANQSGLKVNNSTFENQYFWNPVESVMNLFESALRVRLNSPKDLENNVFVHIDNCTFYNNERAITFQGPIDNVEVHNSRFLNNIAMHAGAGILMLSPRKLLVNKCRFENNTAGGIRNDHFTPPGTFFRIEDQEAILYSECCKGSVSLVGKGGAIRVQKGNVNIHNSYFNNNTASILGGSLFVDRESMLNLVNTTLENTHELTLAAQQGDMLFSGGQVELDGVQLKAKSAANHISLLQHSGNFWSISVYNVHVECPLGYRLRIMNTSSYRIVPEIGLSRGYSLDQLSYFCEACPRYKYSLEVGSYHYQIDRGLERAYYTLKINGDNPSSEFLGIYDYKDISCLKCPYGGNCEDDVLRGLPNFWGYEHLGEIKFQLCPKGYCCSASVCPTYNACAKRRTGRLCSECVQGHTEALFSSKCVSDTGCGPLWLWGFLIGMGMLYALLLFFQKDLRDFIFTMPVMPCKHNSSSDKYNDKHTEQEKEQCLPTNEKQNDLARHVKATNHMTQALDCVSSGDFDTHHTGGQSSDTQNNVLVVSDNCLVLMDSGLRQYHDECLTTEAGQNGDLPAAAAPRAQNKTQIRSLSNNSANQSATTADSLRSTSPAPSTDFGAIMLITILYYFQDAQLLHVKTAFMAPEPPEWALIKAILLGLFKFRLEIAHFVDNVCLVIGLKASMKLLVRTVMVPYVLVLFGLLYFLHWIFCGRNIDKTKKFEARLAMGFMLALLFTYQMLATAAFSLLNCVPVGNESVLFLDATVTCYSGWQYGVFAYALSCIVPFSFVLMLGPGLLQEGRINVLTFFAACIVPLPFVTVWQILRVCKKDNLLSQHKDLPTPPGEVVIKVLQGPFKDIRTRITGPLCWAGVLIFRRLVLVLLYTFINIALFRILAMLIVCFTMLLNQVHVKPYQDPRANVAGSASIAALMFVGGLNLVRAGFEAAEYTPNGPYQMLITIMQDIENILMLWIPLFFMCIVGCLIVFKLIVMVINVCRHKKED